MLRADINYELSLPNPPWPGRHALELRHAFGFGTPAGSFFGTIPGRSEDPVQSADRGLPEPPAADRGRGPARLWRSGPRGSGDCLRSRLERIRHDRGV